MISRPVGEVKIQASPDSLVSLFHVASVLQMMVDSDEICVGGSCDGSVLDRSLAWGCAASHSCRSAMARERITGRGSDRWEVTIAKECCSDSLKVETEPGGEPRGAFLLNKAVLHLFMYVSISVRHIPNSGNYVACSFM